MPDRSNIYTSEKEKYEWLWSHGYRPSKCALPLADYVAKVCDPRWSLLDIGCGDGSTVYSLRDCGLNCQGIDITLAGLKDGKGGFMESSVWKMPYPDGYFDFTFSTDLLEHLPPDFVNDSITEIFRVTRHRTFHSIANFADVRSGKVLHLIRQPVEWWRAKFTALNTKKLKFEIIDRKVFLMAYGDFR